MAKLPISIHPEGWTAFTQAYAQFVRKSEPTLIPSCSTATTTTTTRALILTVWDQSWFSLLLCSPLLCHITIGGISWDSQLTSKLLRLSIHQSSPTLVSSPARIGFYKAANFECSSDSSLAGFEVVIRYSDDGNIIAALSHKIFYFLIRLN